jgi:diadenosine tetraphosphate (Ap4A) HIT family hydrolase
MEQRKILKETHYGEILAHIREEGICSFCCETHPHMIYENEHMYIVPARAPYVEDHLLIIPKRHVVLLQEMNHLETKSLHKMVDEWTKKLHSNHKDVNLLLRDGLENGESDKSVNHLHFHLIPDCSITENTGKAEADRTFLDEKKYTQITKTIKKKYA